jgi:hypothetical protein
MRALAGAVDAFDGDQAAAEGISRQWKARVGGTKQRSKAERALAPAALIFCHGAIMIGDIAL